MMAHAKKAASKSAKTEPVQLEILAAAPVRRRLRPPAASCFGRIRGVGGCGVSRPAARGSARR
jgi:hypothetical protein